MIGRVQGKQDAVETPIGLVPTQSALDWDGLPLSASDREALLDVDRGEWSAEVTEMRAFFERFGTRLPPQLARSLDSLERSLSRVAV